MKLENEQKDDPLKRIQEEINEVARREKELREKVQLQKHQQQKLLQQSSPATDIVTATSTPISGTSPVPPSLATKTATANIEALKNNHNNNNNTSRAMKENLDETHSDDSGFSTSSSPVNGTPAIEKKYIRSTNAYKLHSSAAAPLPPSQKALVRTMSTPQIFQPNNRRFSFNPPQKGIMQRFIASRGKMIAAQKQQQQQNGNNMKSSLLNGFGSNSSLDFFRNNGIGGGTGSSVFIPPVTVTPPVIERDADGRPIRRGYVPVEEKIQKELRDLKNRESELKRLRKLSSRQSQPDLLDSIEDETLESDDESDVEHCFGPGKLRPSKSISELCDALNSNSISPRTTPSPNFDRKGSHHHGGMRPAVSLAQLCDLDPEEAPSSHELIAKWECLIQQNA